WATATEATIVINKISISTLISHLSFSHVESQTQLPVFGSPRSTPIRGRSTDRNAGTSRATEDCVTGGRLVSRCEVWRRFVWLRPDRQESHLPRAAVRLSMSLRLNAKQRIPGQC